MSLTITVPDPLAGRLRTRAEFENDPVEQLAARLLESEIQKPLDREHWTIANDHRLELINKRNNSGLAEEEQEKLRCLQDMVDQ